MAWTFPLCALVGLDEMKLAILIAAIDPSVGGVPIPATAAPASPPPRVRWPRCCRRGTPWSAAPTGATRPRPAPMAACAGPVRDCWMEPLAARLPEGTPLRRMPNGIGDAR